MPDALVAAASIGLEIPASAGIPFTGIRFVGPRQSVTATFPEGSGLGVRRTVLHPLLIDQAERAGVELRWGVAVPDLHRVRARWLIGADGVRSAVRTWAGLDQFRRETRRFGFRRHCKIAPWTDRMEIHWGEGCQFYVTPISPDEICLVLMSRDQHLRIDQALSGFPQLSSMLRGAPPMSAERGAVASTRQLKRVTHANVALIGDASGTVDAITGEGLCLAFQQAAALADALVAGDLRLYEAAHKRVALRPVLMGDFMLSMDRWPRLRARALSTLSSRPELFANLLAMHVGKLGVLDFANTCAALGWGVALG